MDSVHEQQTKTPQHCHDQTPNQEQELSEEQSLQLVMIFINASLACICYCRELVRWNSACFQVRYIEHVCLAGVDHDQIYTNFLSGPDSTQGYSQEVRILVRGCNLRANHVLDMLEEGVFDAIKRAHLDTLHVFVATDADKTREILETYTFQFKYEKSRITTIRLGGTEQAFTLRQSQKSFKAAIRGLLRAMQEMPRATSKCVLGMTMSYTPDCPDSYEPEHFTEASHHGIDRNHWDALWNEPSSPTACFETAYHHVQASSRRLQPFSPPDSLIKDATISRQLQNMQMTSSMHSHALQPTQPAAIASPKNKRKEDRAGGVSQPQKRRKGSDLVVVRYRSSVDSDSNSKGSPSGYGCISHNATTGTPRRKRSISKILVALGSTPDSPRFLDNVDGGGETET